MRRKRSRKLSNTQIKELYKHYMHSDSKVNDICLLFDISRDTFYRYVKLVSKNNKLVMI